ncbi:MAG: sugar phosphate isomerase/epimerase [Pseudomonadota bacterium]
MQTINPLKFLLLIAFSLITGFAQAAPTNPELSVQLWSVKDDVSKDFEGTLKQLASMGFQGVEFAGNFGPYANDAAGLKAFLTKTGLKASGAHVHFDKFSKENFAKTIAFYKAIDCNYLIIPMDKRAFTHEGALVVAKELSALEKKLKHLGMHMGYHNHKEEMLDQNGSSTWDTLAKNTPASVILEQDVAWTEAAGKDPVAIIKQYPGRIVTTHYKASVPGGDSKENPIIGLDTTDWKSLITANRTLGGTQWFVIEQEVYPEGMSPMQSVAASLKGLQQILAEMQAAK